MRSRDDSSTRRLKEIRAKSNSYLIDENAQPTSSGEQPRPISIASGLIRDASHTGLLMVAGSLFLILLSYLETVFAPMDQTTIHVVWRARAHCSRVILGRLR